MFNFFYKRFKDIINPAIKSSNDNVITSAANNIINSYVHYPVEEINNLVMSFTEDTRDLLIEKDFSLSLETEGTAKSVFLNTELSELADAVKKGYGIDEEGLEIADIVIRSCNFLCADEVFSEYTNITKIINRNNDSRIIKIYFSMDKSKTTEESKLMLIQEMMRHWVEIDSSLKYFLSNFRKNNKAKSIAISKLWSDILTLVCMCDLYTRSFLDKNLQFYIEKKMDINHKRPVRYNVSKNIIS